MSGREKLQGIAHMWSLAYTSIHSESKCVHVGSTTCSREDKKEHIRCVWGGGGMKNVQDTRVLKENTNLIIFLALTVVEI